jgi:bifunctional DNA-binding transcriptional regulator/antitoxin component of YhaV-PrlF toxin-antitoxin module
MLELELDRAGRIVIPESVRREMHWEPGETQQFPIGPNRVGTHRFSSDAMPRFTEQYIVRNRETLERRARRSAIERARKR